MKFRKGDKVCALLVANKWGIDFTAFMGRLVRIDERPNGNIAVVKVTRYNDLFVTKKHKPTEFNLDMKVFKLLHWNDETKAEVIELRKASRVLHKMTTRVRSM